MRRDQILVYPRIDQIIGAEAVVRSFKTPDPYLWREIVIDLLNDILVLDDQFEGDDVPGGVDTLVCSGASDEG